MTATDPRFWDGVVHSYIPPAELRIPEGLALHRDVAERVDSVTQEVIRYALLHANLEHSALIQRLCVSPITMLTRDFQTSLLTEVGDLAFLGPNLQYFSNSHALTVKWTLEHRADNPGIATGDILLANDPFVGAPHQPDTSLLGPVFVGGGLFCWVANTLHYADVGGSVPGSFCIDAQDTWAEPTSWPPIKLVERGEGAATSRSCSRARAVCRMRCRWTSGPLRPPFAPRRRVWRDSWTATVRRSSKRSFSARSTPVRRCSPSGWHRSRTGRGATAPTRRRPSPATAVYAYR